MSTWTPAEIERVGAAFIFLAVVVYFMVRPKRKRPRE